MDSNSDGKDFKILKTNAQGHVQRTQEERDSILDAHEASALSGAQFARQHGINYQTFMYWKRLRSKNRAKPTAIETSENTGFTFLEVATEQAAGSSNALAIHVADQIKIELSDPSQVELAADLIRALTLKIEL